MPALRTSCLLLALAAITSGCGSTTPKYLRAPSLAAPEPAPNSHTSSVPVAARLSATCAASSRVGSNISDRGMRARLRPSARMSIIGSTKLAVLPVPVCAMPMMSRIISTLGIADAWIGVGSV